MLTQASLLETPVGTLSVDTDAQKKLDESVEEFIAGLFIGVIWFMQSSK